MGRGNWIRQSTKFGCGDVHVAIAGMLKSCTLCRGGESCTLLGGNPYDYDVALFVLMLPCFTTF